MRYVRGEDQVVVPPFFVVFRYMCLLANKMLEKANCAYACVDNRVSI